MLTTLPTLPAPNQVPAPCLGFELCGQCYDSLTAAAAAPPCEGQPSTIVIRAPSVLVEAPIPITHSLALVAEPPLKCVPARGVSQFAL